MNYFFRIVLLFFLSFSSSSFAATCDTLRVKQLLEEAQQALSEDVHKSKLLAREALELSKTCPLLKFRLDPVIMLSKCHLRGGSPDSAITLIQSSLTNKGGDLSLYYKARLNQTLSSAYIKQADYEKGLRACLNAMNYFEQLHDSLNHSKMLINAANVYQQLGSFSEADKNLRRAEKMVAKLNNLKLNGELYNTLGILYGEQNRADSSEKFFLKSIAAREAIGDKTNLAWNYNNLGGLYALGNEKKKAVPYLEKAFLLFIDNGDFGGLASVTNNLGSVYKDLNNYNQAIHYFNLSRAYNENNNDNLENLYDNLYSLYKSAGKFSEACLYADSLNRLKDTLYGKRLSESLAEMQVKYETNKKENDLKLKDIELASEKKEKNYILFFGIAVVLIVVAGGILLYQRYKRKQEKLRYAAVIQSLEKERTRIAGELHDNSGALVSFIISKSEWAINNKAEADESLAQIKESAREVMTSLRETLWTLSNKTISNIDLCDKLKVYIKKRLLATVEITDEIHDEKTMNNDAVLAIYRCVQECINNINKHSGASAVKILFRVPSNGVFSIEIHDNGVGFENSPTEENYGIKNLIQRMKSINASLVFESKPNVGTFIRISY